MPEFQVRRCLRETTHGIRLEAIGCFNRRWIEIHRISNSHGVEAERQKHRLDSKQKVYT